MASQLFENGKDVRLIYAKRTCLVRNLFLLLLAQSVQIFELHEHTGILGQAFVMSFQVIPIQGRERAGIVSRRF